MTESYLIDLMGDLDTRFLENEYPERDLKKQKTLTQKRRTLRPFKKGNVFVISDTLSRTIQEQRELYDNIVAHPYEPVSERAAHAKAQVKEKVDAVQAKLKAAIAVVSGVAAMIVVIISIVRMVAKKKWLAKLFSKRVQTA